MKQAVREKSDVFPLAKIETLKGGLKRLSYISKGVCTATIRCVKQIDATTYVVRVIEGRNCGTDVLIKSEDDQMVIDFSADAASNFVEAIARETLVAV